jgi:ParB family chromosome partitioning protein
MNKSANLERRFGGHLMESLGLRKQQEPTAKAAQDAPPATDPAEGRTRARNAGYMDLSRIIPDPNQPRKEFGQEAIDRLAESFKKYGQLQPIRARWEAGLAKWIVVSGERRYRAAIQAGLEQVACIFIEGELTPSEILQEQMIENCLREDLKPIEQAKAYRQLMDLHGWTAKQLADELHISQATISRSMAMLALPENLQNQVDAGSVPASAAYEIAKVEDEAVRQDIVDRIVAGSMTRDEVADAVRKSKRRSVRVGGKGSGRLKAIPKPGPRSSSRVIKTGANAKVIVIFNRKTVAMVDVLVALKGAVSQVEAELAAIGSQTTAA